MNRSFLTAALLLTAACGRQDQPAAPAENVAAPAAPAAPLAKATVPPLAGTWRVADADGLTATFAGGQLVLAEGCLRRAWSYTQAGNSVSFTSAPGGSSNCGRTASAALDAAFTPITDANLAVFSADGKTVTLSGLGGSLLLARR
jgi:hypothetical protein